ncbi:MAG: hemerythrin domain-containing protein [Desulfopila sp.]|nr:hemerythrin domain-containing protein [Desulfopila sp.]
MDAYTNKGIKDIIVEFPKVGDILNEYGISCVSCSVGICALKDILDIHTMAPEKEAELMARIEAVIYPGRKMAKAATTRPSRNQAGSHIFSSAMQLLVDEHMLIKRWLALVPQLLDNLEVTSAEGAEIFRGGTDFIRSFADRLHHGKEEDILFTYFNDEEAIFQVIYEDHRTARNHVKLMMAAIEAKDSKSFRDNLTAYAALLTEHIKKEDEILFPWLDRRLTTSELLELDKKFELADRYLAVDILKHKTFIRTIEDRFAKRAEVRDEL